MKTTCPICPHACSLSDGQTGLCGARRSENGTVIDANYGMVTALALDPIEKKPLRHFHPGSMVLSAGSYGCNMKCPFCQNSDISMPEKPAHTVYTTPQELIAQAYMLRDRGNIGVAYTYNEPLVGYEYVMDCARLARENDMKNVVVTNGMVCEEPLRGLLPYIDAMNIDLKAFTQAFYQMAGGDLATVMNSICLAAGACHVEVTTLIIPGQNDSEEEMAALSSWLSSIRPDIPLHISRFFPRYHMASSSATPVKEIYTLAEVARRHLQYVYEGNV